MDIFHGSFFIPNTACPKIVEMVHNTGTMYYFLSINEASMRKTLKTALFTSLLTCTCIQPPQIHAHKIPTKATWNYFKLVTPILARIAIPTAIAAWLLKLPKEERAMISFFKHNASTQEGHNS